jgi:hypothetical protein
VLRPAEEALVAGEAGWDPSAGRGPPGLRVIACSSLVACGLKGAAGCFPFPLPAVARWSESFSPGTEKVGIEARVSTGCFTFPLPAVARWSESFSPGTERVGIDARVSTESAFVAACLRLLLLRPDPSILLYSSSTRDGELRLGTGAICCGPHQIGFATAAQMQRQGGLLSGPDSPTSPDLLVPLPLLSDPAMEAWPESVCGAGLLPIHLAAASPGS